MTQVIGIVCVLALVFALASCSTPAPTTEASEAPAETSAEPAETQAATTEEPADTATEAADSGESDGYEFAMVTDVGTIDDKSFNQGTWEGVKQYAEETNKTYKYYQPAEKTDDAYVETINLAIAGGAKVVVCPGFLFENAIGTCQEANPDTMFIFIDAPESFTPGANTYAVKFAEEESGFLAGYAAVKDGNTKLGFMGGMAVPAVVRYGVGYVAGAEYAAKEMGVDTLDIRYHYMGNFDASPEAQNMAASWYQDGTEIIFGCGGGVGNSIMAAAEAAGAKVIGVDVDQSGESETVITSAMKLLDKAVYDGLAAYDAGNFPGGEFANLTAVEGAVGLPDDFSRFETFTQADYDAIYQKMVDDEEAIRSNIPKDTSEGVGEGGDPSGLALEIVTVDFVK